MRVKLNNNNNNNNNNKKFHWRMKLKKKFSTKVPRIKLEILKKEDRNEKPNI